MSDYFEAADPRSIESEYPLGDAFVSGVARRSRDELRAIQEARFARVIARAFEVPFYRRLWGRAGVEPGDIRNLDDLHRLPTFDKRDLMASVEAFPPLGDYHGLDAGPDGTATKPPRQAVLHTTSGTTGAPQPLFFGPRDREIQNLLLARAYRLQGLRDDDVVHSVYGFGMVNGGHYVREAVLHYTRALLLPAGTGIETPSAQQLALMTRFRVTAVLGFVDYIAKLGALAREAGLEPGRDLSVRLISGHLGAESRDALSAAWGGARVRDWYGVGDTGIVAAETEAAAGLVLFEDAHFVELIDPVTGKPVPDGEPGNLCVTVLFKDGVYPIVRFDTNDLSAILPGTDPLVPAFRRIQGFLGRSDNMVKLRGINVYPTAIVAHLAKLPEATGEYVCRVRRSAGRDEMTVVVEWRGPGADAAAAAVRALLREGLGVGVEVELVAPGATADLTGIERRQKPIRLLDER